ncbi:hypothetical protein BDY19DRAFT_1058028 [Irpex rosettiformis]|uniref:Uncharacterized protein n=1 Tax=Irpex rosettiformis TaxID=378272 RepID=A0ACB8U0C2_9APHY|nr:hypothetical protein BDY19DRAFT_1058028 [Irpex rosettiformis]
MAGSGSGLRKYLSRCDDVIDLGAHTIRLRIVWPAYPDYSIVVPIPMKGPRGPLTRGQLFIAIANQFLLYFEHAARNVGSAKGGVHPGFVDLDIGGQSKLRTQNIFIVSLVHAGSSIWQADVELEV